MGKAFPSQFTVFVQRPTSPGKPGNSSGFNRVSLPMRLPRFLPPILVLLPLAAFAQNSDTSWEKSYALNGRPSLHLEVDDSSLAVHACPGACAAVHIRVIAQNTRLSLYTLEESQSGNAVRFSLKQKQHLGFRLNWHNSQSVRVEVEAPADLSLEARAADGNIALHDLRGDIRSTSSDGSQSIENVSGNLRLQGADGSITVRHSSGSLEARTADGALDVSGSFSALQLHSSDGGIRVALDGGSRLKEPSSIQGSDGSIDLRVPATFPADLDLHTSDGSIQSSLPLTVEGLGSKNDLHGKLDGGGAPLSIRTSDGSIRLGRL